MKLGLFGGGFKPFTTGHFAKLANAIRDNDKVYLFYGIQERKPPKIGKRGKPLKSQQKFRRIGLTDRYYTPEISRQIFDIYERAIERELPTVEVESTIGSTPMRRVFETVEEFASDPDLYDKITIYGDADTIRAYLGKASYFEGLLETGKVQLGAMSPESMNDYLDEDRLLDLITASEESALSSLGSYYSDMSPEDLERLRSVRGTEVREFASSIEGVEEAMRFLPPFLNDSEKQEIIDLLLGEISSSQDQELSELYLRNFIRGIIRG